MTSTDDIKLAWQGSVTDAVLPELDALRGRADLFHRQIRRRNRIEYVASALVVAGFAAIALNAPSLAVRVGAWLVVAAALFIAWQLHRRASAEPPPGAEGALSLLAHQRAQFLRQRDALRTVGRWYLLPFAPGMGLMMLAPIEQGPAALLDMGWPDILSIAFVLAVFGGIWWLNQLAARQLQKAIDELDSLSADPPPR